MMRDDTLLRPAEVRQALGISTATYFRWLRDGRLRGVRVGGRWRFPAGAVEQAKGGGGRGVVQRSLELAEGLLRSRGVPAKEAKRMVDATRGAEGIVMALLAHARAGGATHLHIEPGPGGLSVRERVNGVLTAVGETFPREVGADVAGAVRRLAGIGEGAGASGRFFAEVGGRKLEVRATAYPTGLGESIAMTLLDPEALVPPLANLGFPAKVAAALAEIVRRDRGLFIVNGPTGSGKTTTLYSMLRELKGSGRKIMTAEDPVELLIEGAQQADLGATGMGFVEAIRAMAMSDVNVAMVAELRDAEVMRATLTLAAAGHLVLTVLHAPDAVAALQRLLEAPGVNRAVVADTLLGILDQRLSPVACPSCRRGKPRAGCSRCRGTGVSGRTAAGDLTTATPELRQAIITGADAEGLRAAGGS